MKFGELNRCLIGKLNLTPKQRRAHVDFSPRLKNGGIPLPRLIRMSHGDGEIPPPQVRGIAMSLGLKEHELQTTVSCKISRKSVYLALAVYLLEFVRQLELNCQGGFKGGSLEMARSVELLLCEVEAMAEFRRTEDAEQKLLERLRVSLSGLAKVPSYQRVVVHLQRLLDPPS